MQARFFCVQFFFLNGSLLLGGAYTFSARAGCHPYNTVSSWTSIEGHSILRAFTCIGVSCTAKMSGGKEVQEASQVVCVVIANLVCADVPLLALGSEHQQDLEKRQRAAVTRPVFVISDMSRQTTVVDASR